MLRVSIIMCPDCLSRVPESVAEKFLAAAAWPGAPYPKVTKPSWNYDAEKYPDFAEDCGSIPAVEKK